jgi:hypothetical protein
MYSGDRGNGVARGTGHLQGPTTTTTPARQPRGIDTGYWVLASTSLGASRVAPAHCRTRHCGSDVYDLRCYWQLTGRAPPLINYQLNRPLMAHGSAHYHILHGRSGCSYKTGCPWARGLQKQKLNKNKGQKSNPKKQPTDSPPPFFLRRPLRRVWTCHRMWAPAAGCGVFLCEIVPSDDPLYVVSLRNNFFQRTFFPPLRKTN